MKIGSSLMQQGTYLLDKQTSTTEQINTQVSDLDSLREGTVSGTQDTRTLHTSMLARSLGTISTDQETTSVSRQHMLVSHEEVKSESEVRIWGWRSGDSLIQTSDANENPAEVTHTTINRVTEREQRMIFESVGEVQTEDGRSISFMMQLDFQNDFRHESQGESFTGNAQWIDPLVISLTGEVPQISDGSFEFDLNGDGTINKSQETMGRLSSGMAYIAFDKNSDGIINDGNELFGATSGQGFAELAAYDSDGNGWIDENDAIFERLSVWQPDAENALTSFGQAGVGAIYLHAEQTPFELTNISGQADARITQSSVVLMESGVASNVFQLEWAQRPQDTFTINQVNLSMAGMTINGAGTGQVGLTNSTNVISSGVAPSHVQHTDAQSYRATFMQQYSESYTHQIKATSTQPKSLGGQLLQIQSSSTSTQQVNFWASHFEENLQDSEDGKFRSLRAVIEVLRDMRESNSKQQSFLGRFLVT